MNDEESAASRFLREQASLAHKKEPGATWAELSGAAFIAAYEEFADFLATDYRAPEGHAATVGQFVRDADEYGWRFTAAGELIDEEGTEG